VKRKGLGHAWSDELLARRSYSRHFRKPRERHLHLFFRLFAAFGCLSLVFLGGVGVLVSLAAHLFVGGSETSAALWMVSLVLVVGLSVLGWGWAVHSFKNVASPLADVIQAADALSHGRLDVRVPEDVHGDFGRLAQTFNRMAGELESADRHRRDMMADIAHELRTPLHILQGNLEGLQDGVYQPTPEQFGFMLEETRRLGRLVEELRTLSLAEAGKLRLEVETVAVGEILEDMGTSFEALAEDAGIDLRVVGGDEVRATVLEADIGRLHQLLGNLLMNALRHTPRGGTITLRAETLHSQMRLAVQDTGSGIPPAELPHVFDRYWQGGQETSRGGSGLGLAIARQLVELHGGRISVESEPGQGTTFVVVLPLRQA